MGTHIDAQRFTAVPAANKTFSVFFEIWKRDWSNPHTGIKFFIGNTTAVDASFVIEDWRTWAVTTVTRRDGDFGHGEIEDACHNR